MRGWWDVSAVELRVAASQDGCWGRDTEWGEREGFGEHRGKVATVRPWSRHLSDTVVDFEPCGS